MSDDNHLLCYSFFFSKGQVKETFEAITQKSKGNKKRKEKKMYLLKNSHWHDCMMSSVDPLPSGISENKTKHNH